MLTIWNVYVQTIKHQTLTERKLKYQLQIITQESFCYRIFGYNVETTSITWHFVTQRRVFTFHAKVQVLAHAATLPFCYDCPVLLPVKWAPTERYTITYACDIQAQTGITVHAINCKGMLIVLCSTYHLEKMRNNKPTTLLLTTLLLKIQHARVVINFKLKKCEL